MLTVLYVYLIIAALIFFWGAVVDIICSEPEFLWFGIAISLLGAVTWPLIIAMGIYEVVKRFGVMLYDKVYIKIFNKKGDKDEQ